MLKANATPQNYLNKFYQSLAAIRAAEHRIAEVRNQFPQGLTDYREAFDADMICVACGDFITDIKRAYRDSATDVLFHNRDCAGDWEMMQ